MGVYKVGEGPAHILATQPDEQIEDYLDQLIAKFAAAHQDDGYLNTYYTLVEPDQRSSNLPVMHELYCAGPLFEAIIVNRGSAVLAAKPMLFDLYRRLVGIFALPQMIACGSTCTRPTGRRVKDERQTKK